jgi:hypothetical protein
MAWALYPSRHFSLARRSMMLAGGMRLMQRYNQSRQLCSADRISGYLTHAAFCKYTVITEWDIKSGEQL